MHNFARRSVGRMKLVTSLIFASFVQLARSEGDDFKPKPLYAGAWVHPSRGEIWPKPKSREKYPTFMAIDPNDFTIKVSTSDNSVRLKLFS